MSTNKLPLVTAIITTYKRSPSVVSRALKSVLHQTYTNLEIIVVDDSPSEYTLREQVKNIILSFNDSRISYISHVENKGACVARNTGLELAKGKYIAYLDDDDEWLPEKITQQVAIMENSPLDIALVYCNNLTMNDVTGSIIESKRPLYDGVVFDLLILNNFIGSTSYPLLRTDALRDVGGFDPLFRSAQDYDVWLRIASKYKITYTEKALAVYHVHGKDCISGNPQNKIDGLEKIIKNNSAYLKNNKSAYLTRLLKITPYYAAAHNYKKAIWIWLKVSLQRPQKIKENLYYLYSIYRYGFKYYKK